MENILRSILKPKEFMRYKLLSSQEKAEMLEALQRAISNQPLK